MRGGIWDFSQDYSISVPPREGAGCGNGGIPGLTANTMPFATIFDTSMRGALYIFFSIKPIIFVIRNYGITNII